tara:strand:+ start:390 stop:671 length:282 start_codon:yes stop_codon:yes gene_type:complete
MLHDTLNNNLAPSNRGITKGIHTMELLNKINTVCTVEITQSALELGEFLCESCPNLIDTPFSYHSILVDIVTHFEGDIDACKTALKKTNKVYQ